jgi:hypothetical protein
MWILFSTIWGESKRQNASPSVGALASKLATFLSIATLHRAREVAAIDKKSVNFTAEGVFFSLFRFRKAQKRGALQSLFLKRLIRGDG